MNEGYRVQKNGVELRPEASAEGLKNSSVWLSEEQAASLEHVGNVMENPGRRLRIMRTEDGRLFCELEKKPPRQAATAILLKGIVPVCDIKMVKDPDGVHYYSYIAPLTNESFKGEQTDEIQADARVISLLFNGEHWAGRHDLKNIRLDEKQQAVFFDFDQSDFDLSSDKGRIRQQLEYTREQHPGAISLIKEKLATLKAGLTGQPGEEWFKSALQHIGYEPQEDHISRTYEEYKSRVQQGNGSNGVGEYYINTDDLLLRLRNKVDAILEVLSEEDSSHRE